MTIQQLVDKLRGFDPGWRVVTPGFDESDLEDVTSVELVRVVFHDEKEPFHGGRHQEAAEGIPAVKVDWQ